MGESKKWKSSSKYCNKPKISKSRKFRHNGELAEYIAYKYLLSNNLHFICKNFFCRYGEIDLIMIDLQNKSPNLVFIEVKYRKNDLYGHPIDFVNKIKQNKLIKSAYFYILNNNKFNNMQYRFDAVTILGSIYNLDNLENYSNIDINWYKNIINI